jgi:hypothetical protein
VSKDECISSHRNPPDANATRDAGKTRFGIGPPIQEHRSLVCSDEDVTIGQLNKYWVVISSESVDQELAGNSDSVEAWVVISVSILECHDMDSSPLMFFGGKYS